MKVYLNIFGKQIPIYGLLFLAGLLLGGLFAFINSRKRNLKGFDVVSAACFAGIGGIIGAKLLSVLTTLRLIIEQKPPLMDIISNGFVFYGGLIGGAFGLVLYCKIYKLDSFKFMDVFAPSVPLGHAIGRVGCYISGCCFGVPYNGPLAVTYYNPIDINTPKGVPLLPIQLIESVALLVLFIVLQTMFVKSKKKGLVASVYLYGYAIIRFILEFFRGDLARGLVGGLSTSQIISIIIVFITTMIITFRQLSFNKKTSNNNLK